MIGQDVRYAFRSLGRAPGFTLVAVITLALGIGATTAIFSVVDGILLRPLPYPDPSRIVTVARVSNASRADGAFAAADFIDYKRDTRSFAALAGFRQDIIDLTGGIEPIRLITLETTAEFFDVIGLPPLMGRGYAESDRASGSRVVVISEVMWRQHLGGDPQVLGRTVRLNGVPHTVIGVMAERLVHPQKVDMWTLAPQQVPTSPIPIEGDALASREVQYFQVIGRLAPAVSLEQANADLRAVADRLAREYPDTNGGEWAEATSFHELLVGDIRSALLMLLGAVGFVLLIACANVASLLLARGTARRRELAVRSALGAKRGRLVRQLLTESVLLASVGGAIGLLVAYWGVDALIAIAPESIPRLGDVQVDPRVAAFTLSVSAMVGVLFGIVPALQGARPDLVDALKDGGRTGTARAGAQRTLVVAEVALALVLLIGAGLMLTSFSRLRAVDVGFNASNLVVVFVPLPQARYNTEAQTQFYTRLLERLHANPVTQRSALVFPTPFGGGNARGGYSIEGAAEQQRSERPMVQINSVTPGYFQTMGIPVLRGRDVELSDTRDRAGVVVINQTLAEREWPHQDPIGKRLTIGGGLLTVVGVVGDSKRSDLEGVQQPAVYMSHAAFALPFMGAVVRSELSEGAITAAVREAVRSLDPELPVENADTVETILERTTGQPRFRALLVTAFAAVALVLAGVGLYGLISYTVAQRVPEIGVRLALGATPAQVGALIVRQGLGLAAAGVAIGVVGAIAATRVIEGLLFSVSATDPVVYSGLATLLLSIAALACYVPARRAMRVDPLGALRSDG
ncbi:MAG TPA: ABC transporter permease [Vicinamibacterales bacterium]|nr:ABC transporter permease [Vicinamibacterales bacterium]